MKDLKEKFIRDKKRIKETTKQKIKDITESTKK
jgi:hypothetical protein